MQSHWNREGPYSDMTGVLTKRRNLDQTHTQGERLVKMKGEIRVISLHTMGHHAMEDHTWNAKNRQQTTRRAGRGTEQILSHSPWKDPTLLMPRLRLVASRTARQYISIV